MFSTDGITTTMGINSLDDVYDGVKFDIPWMGTEPPPPLEAVDLLTLDQHELVDYVRDLQHETSILRALVHEALTVVRRLTVQCDQARARIALLLHELRRVREAR